MKFIKNIRPQLSRKQFFMLTVFILLLSWIIWGNITIQISHFSITDPELPFEFDDYKIAHISDIQSKNWGERLLTPLKAENPDAIVITGDLIDRSEPDISNAVNFIEEVTSFAPTYFVSGNHEARNENYETLKEHMLEDGVIVLENETTSLERNGTEISLSGLQDPAFLPKNNAGLSHSAILENEVEQLAENGTNYHILLAHNPAYFRIFVEHNINLVFSGHVHGGQFRLPIIGGLLSPDHLLFPKYSAGIYEADQTKMVVSRGLGNSIIPFRINNRPELIFVTLTSE